MTKRFFPTLLGIVIALSSFIMTPSTAWAGVGETVGTQRGLTTDINARRFRCSPSCWPVLNQSYYGSSYSHLHGTFIGHNLDNSGNEGNNHGYSQNYGGNAGNAISSRGNVSRFSRINQQFFGNSYHGNVTSLQGDNEGNSGDEGVNMGVNEDHGSNGGNQAVS